MVVEIRTQICDGYALSWLFHAGLEWLTHNQERVNRLNVFPVPDGDTGKNMCLTLRKGYDAIAGLDEGHVGIVADTLANGALLGARGNSGVILSQLLRGFADGLIGHEVFDADLLARAAEKAVDAAYRAVIQPTEGTILTVARGIYQGLIEYIKEDRDLIMALRAMLDHGQQTLDITPNLLPVLREAGVVDSGGQGLVYMLEGMMRAIEGKQTNIGDTIHEVQDTHDPDWEFDAELPPDDEEGYGYDVQFLMHGEGLDVDKIRAEIDAMGWSTLVVGSPSLIKVHVHVHDPGKPISYAIARCDAIDDVVVENMQLQYEARMSRTPKAPRVNRVEGVAVITVASGHGLRELFYEGLSAAYVISGGQTMNPSADDFLSAMQLLDNDQIILMPNNKNVVLAAKQAAKMANGRTVRVLPTTSVPQGISAMLAYLDALGEGDIDEVFDAMQDIATSVTTGEITRAVRDATFEKVQVRQGQFITLLNGKLVAGSESLEDALRAFLLKAGTDERELVTLYYGNGLNEAETRDLLAPVQEEFPTLQFEVVEGGQPLYPLLIGIE